MENNVGVEVEVVNGTNPQTTTTVDLQHNSKDHLNEHELTTDQVSTPSSDSSLFNPAFDPAIIVLAIILIVIASLLLYLLFRDQFSRLLKR